MGAPAVTVVAAATAAVNASTEAEAAVGTKAAAVTPAVKGTRSDASDASESVSTASGGYAMSVGTASMGAVARDDEAMRNTGGRRREEAHLNGTGAARARSERNHRGAH